MTSQPQEDGSDKDRTSPGGRSVFNIAMSPRPSEDVRVNMNQILRQKITSPTHMRRFDSADYFMERDFPNSDEEGSRSSRKNTDDGDLHEQLSALDDDRQSESQQTRRPESNIRHAPLVRKKPPPQLETRWATHTTRPAELALNSPHPAGPRALRQGSIHDVFADVETQEDQAEVEARAMADMNAVLRAKLAGKSRLRRFDSADYFLNHETGRLQQRRPPPGLHHTVSSPGRVNSSSPRPNVSPIKSLAISTNVGSRSRGNSIADESTATAAGGQQTTESASTAETTAEAPETTTRKTPLRGVIPSPNRLQRSRPRALQPGHQERYDLRTHLRQRAEIAAKVPQSPSDNVNVFFRKKYSPNTLRAMEAAGVGNNKNLRRSLASLSGPSTPQKGTEGGGSTPSSMPRQRRNSRAMPTSESLRTPADIRKAALHSRLNSQGKAL